MPQLHLPMFPGGVTAITGFSPLPGPAPAHLALLPNTNTERRASGGAVPSRSAPFRDVATITKSPGSWMAGARRRRNAAPLSTAVRAAGSVIVVSAPIVALP
jgi:hypothetical protein